MPMVPRVVTISLDELLPLREDTTVFLQEWQALIGAFLGVFAAVVSAIVIVFLTQAVRRRNAAHMLFYDLHRYMQTTDAARAAARATERYQETQKKEGPVKPQHVEASVLFRNRPRLSVVFQRAAAELASADAELALELAMFQGFHDAAEKMLSLTEEMENRLLFEPKGYEPPKSFLGYLESGLKHTESAVERAAFITELITRLYRDGPRSPLRRLYRAVFMRRILKKRIEAAKALHAEAP